MLLFSQYYGVLCASWKGLHRKKIYKVDKLKEKKALKNLEPTTQGDIASQMDCDGDFNPHLTTKYVITDTKIYTINFIQTDYPQR